MPIRACASPIASTQFCENLGEQDLPLALDVEHTTEVESQTAEAMDYLEAEQKTENLEQGNEDNCLVEKDQNAQNLEPEPDVLRLGCRVKIISGRQGEEIVGLLGDVLVANTNGCVVEVR